MVQIDLNISISTMLLIHAAESSAEASFLRPASQQMAAGQMPANDLLVERERLDRGRLRQANSLVQAAGRLDATVLSTITAPDIRASRVFSGGLQITSSEGPPT